MKFLFHFKHFSTFVCPTELIALDERYEDFKKINAEVIGISVDSHYTHLGWMNTKRNVRNILIFMVAVLL